MPEEQIKVIQEFQQKHINTMANIAKVAVIVFVILAAASFLFAGVYLGIIYAFIFAGAFLFAAVLFHLMYGKGGYAQRRLDEIKELQNKLVKAQEKQNSAGT